MKSFFIAMFSLCAFTAAAQHQISGTVKDADGAPVPFATAALLRPDSTAITGVITGNDGKFVLLANVAAGDYILQVSFIGYNKEYRRVNVPSQSELGEIILTESASRLSEVVVTAARPLVVNRADRYVVNVSGNIQSAGRDALDIMRNTPGLLVNQNGDITLMGNRVQIWIDGRPSQMSGEQLQAFLKSMQGGEIDRIEVITNPSSRYEAEGTGGIIDIRTRKGLELGVNGTLTGGYQKGRKDRGNVGVNLNLRHEKYNVFGNYSINNNTGWERSVQNNVLQTPDGPITFDQKAIAQRTKVGLRHSVRAGMDYFINSSNILGIIINAYHSNYGTSDSRGITDISPIYNGVSYSTSDFSKTDKSDGIQVNMNYQFTFSNPGQRLNFDLDYARFGSDPLQKNANKYYDPADMMIGDIEQFSNANPQIINVYSAKIDYTQPLWKDARAETGAKFGQSTTDNDLKYEKFVNNVWQLDSGRSNRFVYMEQISAAYINISQRLGKFNFQAGLRGEYTYHKGDQKTTGEVNDTTYFKLFPTFFMNYQASPQHSFGLSYSRRLTRPSYSLLNPFEIALDAYSFTKGNPNLKPSYRHTVQLSYTLGQGLMVRISYGSTTDYIMLKPIEDVATQRYGTTYANFSRFQTVVPMVNYRRQIVKTWTANLYAEGAYQINTSQEESGEFVNKGIGFYVQLNNNITITPSLSAEITGMYISKMRQGYLVIQPMGNLSIGFRQILLKDKMNLSLTINDILFTNKEKVYARYENVNYALAVNRDSRYASLTLRYNFGSTTVKAARNKSTGIEDETSRAGGR